MFDKKKDQKPSAPKKPAPEVIVSPPSISVSTESTPKMAAVIGPTITIKGDINGDENLLIEGKIEGTVNLGFKDLTIGKTGRVYANVNAKEITIEGEVQGDITGNEKVIVSKTGVVNGNIIAPRVTLEDGANFKGSIDMDPTEKSSAQPALKTVKNLDKSKKTKINLDEFKSTDLDDFNTTDLVDLEATNILDIS